MRRILPALLLLALAGPAAAAPDPALLALERKVELLQRQLDLAQLQLDAYLVQYQLTEPRSRAVQEALNDSRRRGWEDLLLACAEDRARCAVPQALTSNALNPECPELDEDPDQPEILSYLCPLKEMYVTVLRALEAAERQGLRRDLATARANLDAAAAAVAMGDGESAFWSACTAYKALACR